MAHSGESKATMYASDQPGATAMRTLASDDIDGICTVYRPDGERAVLDNKVTIGPQCDPTPRRGFTSQCADTTTKSCTGSSVSPAGPGGAGARGASEATWLGILGALGMVAAVRLRRRR
jgi:hypothetical protein